MERISIARIAVSLAFAALASAPRAGGAETAGSLLSVDHRGLVSRADLDFDKPVARSEHGLPIGNGRMGTLLWTTPAALHAQINRVDLFAFNSYSGVARGPAAPAWGRKVDYCGGAGGVTVDFGSEVFPANATRQRLSLYDARATVEGCGVTVRALAWHARDVLAFQIDDRRERPQPIRVELSMLRPPLVKTGRHTAQSKLSAPGGRILLTQAFTEPASTGVAGGDHYAASAVAIGAVGRVGGERHGQSNDDAPSPRPSPGGRGGTRERIAFVFPAAKGAFTVLVASAASMDRAQDVVAAATVDLEAAAKIGYAGMAADNQRWWGDFWARSFVRLHSPDGIAGRIEQLYTTYLYLMGSSSRGKYPPKFNGMIWSTRGDQRAWGSQFWWFNTQAFYRAPLEANHAELMDPMFDLYSGMFAAQEVAARQQWGSRGVWLPETVSFNGLERLPDALAAELQDLLLERRPWREMSAAMKRHLETVDVLSSRWNFLLSDVPPYCYTQHIFSSTAKIAYLFWQRYEHTLDDSWLRDRAYPMLKGAAEFYRHFPNLKKSASDGKYHIYNVNNHEPIWGGQDTMDELASIRGVLPLAMGASEILGVDAELRAGWRELLENLRPLPMADEPEAVNFAPGLRTWAPGLGPTRHGRGGTTLLPCRYFDLCTLETEDPRTLHIAQATFEHNDGYKRVLAGKQLGPLSPLPIEAAMLGRAADVKAILTLQATKYWAMLPNRLALDELAESQNAEMIGNLSAGLQRALMQSVPPGPGKAAVIRVFPAWPREWDAAFRLAARGGFLVAASMAGGQIEIVEITSQLGGPCRVRNPWPNAAVTLYRNGAKAEELSGSLLTFVTARNELVQLTRHGLAPARIAVP